MIDYDAHVRAIEANGYSIMEGAFDPAFCDEIVAEIERLEATEPPSLKGNAFVGSMFEGRTRATGHLRRITFEQGRPIQREPILTELHQRIRDVRQGPDGLLYLLTDENPGVVLKVEPAP